METYSNTIRHKFGGSRFVSCEETDRQTADMTNLIVASRNFVNSPKACFKKRPLNLRIRTFSGNTSHIFRIKENTWQCEVTRNPENARRG